MRTASIYEFEEALAIGLPRAIGPTGDGQQIDDTENLAP
jgi:hypothetical protein